ncbi:MAG: ABC transporter permease [Firmicutes bacterium]|nr:ABC transporter permease [Bacillota bacterium]
MSENTGYERIPAEKFAFVQENERITDQKFKTKARGFFADAMIRFCKNKSSVVATIILVILILYSIVAPFISPYEITDKDGIYLNYPPYVRWISDLGLGIFDGSKTLSSQNDASMDMWEGVYLETGLQPVIGITAEYTTTVKQRGKEVERYTYDIEVNAYYAKGVIYRNLTYSEFEKIQEWQNETGIQVIYPYVEDTSDSRIWYETTSTGAAARDDDGNYIPAYSTNSAIEGAEYNSLRIEGDDGSYIYSVRKAGSVQVRLCYYTYYQYMNDGLEPCYIMGTNAVGQDIFCAIGVGARFSLIFAVVVSVINLSIGLVYGSLQGYYGGWVDMLLDRIADILSGVPFVVVTTLFQLHLANKVGIVPSFLFAFVLTGWIGMSSLTRRQFYRFKGQEFVLASKTLGASDKRVMFKHILPNGIGSIITSCALVIPGVIRSETTMTYLGIVDLSSAFGSTIGTLLSQGNSVVTTAPHALLFPSIFLGLLMICFNLFGNGLRDAFNPTTRGEGD